MERRIGTISRGLRGPIIKEGDDLTKVVVDTLLECVEKGDFEIGQKDVLAITESILARAQNNYATTEQLAEDVKNKLGGETVGVVFPILSRNRFAICLRGIARGAKNPEAVPYFLRYYLDPSNYDLNSFYCNKQNLEVYNWCMSQKNTIWSTYYESDEDEFSTAESGLRALQGNQVKSYIDSNAYMIDNRVKNFNKLVSQLKK